jgi:hypothetical protein
VKLVKQTVLEQLSQLNPTIKNLYTIGPVQRADIEQFVEHIVAQCVTQCEQVATAADWMTKSEFVTEHGRMLHEGMWGGAKNCATEISEYFYDTQTN